MTNANALIQKADIEHIVQEGKKIYKKIKARYEPKHIGDFLAIDIETKKAYMAKTSAEAVQQARAERPNTVFYVVKIGFSVAESLARMGISSKKWMELLVP